MKCYRGQLAVLAASTCVAVSFAAIPEPDVVLYGHVSVDGIPVGADDDVTIVARVAEASQPIGSYHMGDNQGAGDLYVLRLRVESLADGSSQSVNKALVDQSAQIYVQEGGGPEQLTASFVIPARGAVQIFNLPAEYAAADFEPDGDVDLSDYDHFQACISGAGTPQNDPACQDADVDNDNDVDLADFAALQRCMSGSHIPADPTCAN